MLKSAIKRSIQAECKRRAASDEVLAAKIDQLRKQSSPSV